MAYSNYSCEICHVLPSSESISLLNGASLAIRERGAVYTRQEVVEFILDLVGYNSQRDLEFERLLEPACGEGNFLIPAVKRLLESSKKNKKENESVYERLKNSVRAVELHPESLEITKSKLFDLLTENDVPLEDCAKLLKDWLILGDFLLIKLPFDFTFIVGNPPYIRQELLSSDTLSLYRQMYKTMFDRADIYVAFIEKSLTSLALKGQCGIICSDRWMKNRYGGPLRDFVSCNFHLKIYVDMTDSAAFDSEVTAYPAITVIENDKGLYNTAVASNPKIEPENLRTLALNLNSQNDSYDDRVHVVSGVCRGSEPWIFGSVESLLFVRRLEDQFPLLEETGCKVGIGVATGADDIYIASMQDLDIEDSRKIPLIMTGDIHNKQIIWSGNAVVNPFLEDGSLVNLNDYPKLKLYLESNKSRICQRHVANKNPIKWYRTIDRINPALTHKKKLLIPDISGQAQIIHEFGLFYPHHNLYYITSDKWDLRVLQGILLSGVAHLFVEAYSTQMRGKYLRFQAQYLRRIRIPYWESLSEMQKKVLVISAEQEDPTICDGVIAEIYNLSENEIAIIQSKRGLNAH